MPTYPFIIYYLLIYLVTHPPTYLSTYLFTYPPSHLLITYYNLPTYLQMIFIIILKIDYLNHLTNPNGPLFTNQNDYSSGPYLTSQKNRLSHIGHVKINLSKLTRGVFLPLSKSCFFTKVFGLKTQEF
jgi:hypothetical protein